MGKGNDGDISLQREKILLQIDELKLKQSEFDFKKDEARYQKKIERWKSGINIGSVIVAAVALAVPVWIAAINIRAERVLSENQAKLTFQMKVADLALANAMSAGQAKERALALAELFGPSPLLPVDFAKDFDPGKYRLHLGQSIKAREDVIALIAQYPQQRQQILKDWYVLFWWHRWWVEPMLDISEAELRELDDRGKRLRENESRLND